MWFSCSALPGKKTSELLDTQLSASVKKSYWKLQESCVGKFIHSKSDVFAVRTCCFTCTFSASYVVVTYGSTYVQFSTSVWVCAVVLHVMPWSSQSLWVLCGRGTNHTLHSTTLFLLSGGRRICTVSASLDVAGNIAVALSTPRGRQACLIGNENKRQIVADVKHSLSALRQTGL